MSSQDSVHKRESTRIVLDPPTFKPPREMRAKYLEDRKAELPGMMESANNGEWKSVLAVANHVRGTGAMYGFDNIGDAAENLVKAVENGYGNSLEFMEQYAKVVKESYI